MRLDQKLIDNVWYGDQDGIDVINNLIDVGDENFLQFRMRHCKHNGTEHVNTDIICYINPLKRKRGKQINKLVGFDVIAHEIDIYKIKKKYN